MKTFLFATALMALGAPAFAGDVAVSISVGEPGFFGQIDLGNAPQPRLVYARPVVIERAPEYRDVAPIYLHVPPGHEKHWSKHCREYNACGRPVYFVRDDWYNNEYVPHHHHADRDRDHDHRGEGHDRGRHEGEHRDDDHGDRDHR
jgi:hypothetical protein